MFNRGRCILVVASAVCLHCVGDDSTMTVDAGMDTSVSDTSTGDASNDVATEANPCATAPTLTYYVNTATGNDANSGAGPSCAMKTITAALMASNTAAHANATINIAAGTYNLDEQFPLIVDRGRSLVGAGATMTIIQGSSSTFNTNATGSFLDSGTHFVTILAGDLMVAADAGVPVGATTISDLSVLPPTTITMPTTNYLGIVCIAGNAPPSGAVLPLPPPNLILNGVTVGPNFDADISLSYETSPAAGCNALVTNSTITGANTGLITGGCGGTTNPTTSSPSAQIGDGQPADANTFTTSTVDLLGSGCGSIQSINFNHFSSGYRGIVLISGAAQYFEILSNTFTGGSTSMPMGIGVNTNSGAVINKLNGNTFTNISETAAADTAVGGTSGYAIAFGGSMILQARSNLIDNNDNGILLSGNPSSTMFDFSSGGMTSTANQIFCNSKPPSPPVGIANGYDVILGYGSGNMPNFQGNTWDDGSPTTSASLTTSPNGTDIVGTSVAVTTGGVTTGATCTGGRVHQ